MLELNNMHIAQQEEISNKDPNLIAVYVDITAPMYWWKQFDELRYGNLDYPYDVLEVACKEPITVDSFSLDNFEFPQSEADHYADVIGPYLVLLESLRTSYIDTSDIRYYRLLFQLLPSSFNYTRTVLLDYVTMLNILRRYSYGKLNEWQRLCDWIKELPNFNL